jgi:hypothetical protein
VVVDPNVLLSAAIAGGNPFPGQTTSSDRVMPPPDLAADDLSIPCITVEQMREPS